MGLWEHSLFAVHSLEIEWVSLAWSFSFDQSGYVEKIYVSDQPGFTPLLLKCSLAACNLQLLKFDIYEIISFNILFKHLVMHECSCSSLQLIDPFIFVFQNHALLWSAGPWSEIVPGNLLPIMTGRAWRFPSPMFWPQWKRLKEKTKPPGLAKLQHWVVRILAIVVTCPLSVWIWTCPLSVLETLYLARILRVCFGFFIDPLCEVVREKLFELQYLNTRKWKWIGDIATQNEINLIKLN